MTKQERIEQLRVLNEPDYSTGTTPYIVGDEEGDQRGITEGYEIGYDEAIDKACEWFEKYLAEIGYPDDWCRDSTVQMSGEDRFRQAMEE